MKLVKALSLAAALFISVDFLWAQKPDLTGRQLITDSLTIAGCHEGSKNYIFALEKYDELVQQLNEQLGFEELDEESTAEKILSFMYENLLDTYVENQTETDIMLLSGRYNCVSASVLYSALAKTAGLNVKAQVTADHCFIVYYGENGKTDVETTNPYGFNPGVKRKVSSDSSRYTVVPKKKYAGRKEVSDGMLAILPAKNLCARFSEKNMDQKSVLLAKSILKYGEETELPADEYEECFKLFDTVCSNAAINLDHKYRYDEALDFLDEIKNQYGKRSKLENLYANILNNGIAHYYNNRQVEAAENFYGKRKDRLPEKTRGEFDSMFRKNSLLTEIQNVYNDRKITDDVRYLKIADISKKALEEFPGDKDLQYYLNTAYKNYEVVIHNYFVNYYNARDFDKALEVLDEGLRNAPDCTSLKKDRNELLDIIRKLQ